MTTERTELRMRLRSLATPPSVRSCMQTNDARSRIALLAIFLGACAPASTWRGTVTDCRTTAPVSGADVQLEMDEPATGSGVTTTDDAGRFAFAIGGATKATPAKLTVAKKGYQTLQKSYSEPTNEDAICVSPTR